MHKYVTNSKESIPRFSDRHYVLFFKSEQRKTNEVNELEYKIDVFV
jgi:hypothetical protein